MSVFNRTSRRAKTRPNRHSSQVGIPRPQAESRSDSSGVGAENQTKNGTKKPVIACSNECTEEEGEETGEAEGAGGSRDVGVEIRERELKLRWGAHDRRYKVDEVPFSTDQSANSSTPQNISFLLSMAELGKVSPRSRSNLLTHRSTGGRVAEQRRHLRPQLVPPDSYVFCRAT